MQMKQKKGIEIKNQISKCKMTNQNLKRNHKAFKGKR